jgi:transcriptional regulator with XRE-family HTH domain
VDVDDEARTIGRRVRQIRHARGKSLRVVAGLAGISASHLHRIETGQRALDSRAQTVAAQTVALANALQISPSELISLPVPAPGNGETDAAIQALRLALMAVSHGLPGGQVLPPEELRARVTTTIDALCRCERERDVRYRVAWSDPRPAHHDCCWAGRGRAAIPDSVAAHPGHRPMAEYHQCAHRPSLASSYAGPTRRWGP